MSFHGKTFSAETLFKAELILFQISLYCEMERQNFSSVTNPDVISGNGFQIRFKDLDKIIKIMCFLLGVVKSGYIFKNPR